MPSLSSVYNAGLAEETRVIAFLRKKFPETPVKLSSKDQNIFEDIDCFLGEEAISIKAQHTGAAYGNICFELLQKPYALQTSSSSYAEADLRASGWLPSWYYTSQADTYAIIQADYLYLYSKHDIQQYVSRNGWLRTRTLTNGRRRYLTEGNYRFSDALCGFLPTTGVTHTKHHCPFVTPSAPSRVFTPKSQPLVLL